MTKNLIPPQPISWTNARVGAGTVLLSKTMPGVNHSQVMQVVGRAYASLALTMVIWRHGLLVYHSINFRNLILSVFWLVFLTEAAIIVKLPKGKAPKDFHLCASTDREFWSLNLWSIGLKNEYVCAAVWHPDALTWTTSLRPAAGYLTDWIMPLRSGV